jgi:hypothetical protein
LHQFCIDFKKAYDPVRKEVLHNILIVFGIPMKMVRLIKMCLTETCSSVRVGKNLSDMFPINLDIWLAVHHSITFLLIPTGYTNFLFIYTNYIKLISSTCFERIPPIIRRSTTQIVHMQPLVSSLSASDCLVRLHKTVTCRE